MRIIEKILLESKNAKRPRYHLRSGHSAVTFAFAVLFASHIAPSYHESAVLKQNKPMEGKPFVKIEVSALVPPLAPLHFGTWRLVVIFAKEDQSPNQNNDVPN